MITDFKTQFDIPEMLEVYSNHENYTILNIDSPQQKCIIYFSGHGLYIPNHPDIFHQKIVKENRFEWKSNILKSACKVIFVRDVKKQWYLEGINSQINNIYKLCDFLRTETNGLKVICVGNSAGGYAATLVGSLLGASHIFSFSGQFSLFPLLEEEATRRENPTLVKYENVEEYRKYYSLLELLKTTKVPIFFLYPAKCQIDIDQAKLISNIENVYSFAFDTTTHGVTCYPINFLDLFKLDVSELLDLFHKYQNKLINPFDFSVSSSGYSKTILYLPRRQIKSLLKQRRNAG